ncbi:hypothetical protein [Halomarina litorea]|uniref:hypothetical protein n=1 Tax=Halomarina litorea TaxID=2961595 RepID=UPI0020C3BACB|nr:hypothetical protein [Halomarina sp. BCD28]
MAKTLDLVYSIVVLLVATGGVAGVFWLGWSERREAQSYWGLAGAAVAILFVAALVASLVTTLF